MKKAPYGAISEDVMVSFSRRELCLVFRALLKTIPAFRNSIRIFTPLSAFYALSHENSRWPLFSCLGGICYFYMDGRDGHIYPCGYRGDEDMGASAAELRTRSDDRQMLRLWFADVQYYLACDLFDGRKPPKRR